MAKRKAARAAGRRKTAVKTARRRPQARAKARRLRKASGRLRKASASQGRRKASGRLRKALASQARKARKARKAKKATARKATARKVGRLRKASASQARAVPKSRAVSKSKVPALNRERRTVREEDLVPSPPSSLDLDRSASAARSGRRELHERFTQHTETSPALTGGDIDADWESAYSVGDEAPGGDNPTPDQDIVDDIGKAIGVQYEDNEELKGEKKIADRDKKRWELDPASAEDYNDR